LRFPAPWHAKLSDLDAPALVRDWIAEPPPWLEIHDATGLPQAPGLDEGEAAAIALAEFLHADLVMIDERDGFRVAKGRGLRITGTLGLLDMAADKALLDFAEAIQKLERTSFRRPEALLNILLKKHAEKSGDV
jgi:predicted nucleic acid-binding protein